MGIISSIGGGISKTYTTIDKAVGGILPGGAPKANQEKATITTITPTKIIGNLPGARGSAGIDTPTFTVQPGTTTTQTYGGGGVGSGQSQAQAQAQTLPQNVQQSTNKIAQIDVQGNVPVVQTLQQFQQQQYKINTGYGYNKQDVPMPLQVRADQPQTVFQKIKSALLPKSQRSTGQSLASTEELQKAGLGYYVGGYKSPTPTGAGTIISPNMGDISTRTDVKFAELAPKEFKIQQSASKIQSEIDQKVNNQISNLVDYYQGEVDAGRLNVKAANENLKTNVGLINEAANNELQARLQASPEYHKAVMEYQQKATELGAEQTVTGKTYFPELTITEKQRETNQLKGIAETTLTGAAIGATVLAAPEVAIPVGAALGIQQVATAPTEMIYNPLTGQVTNQLTKVDLSKGIVKGVLGSGEVQAGLGFAMIGGAAMEGIGVAVKGINEETALNKLNSEILVRQFTPKEIRTGKIKVNIEDFKTGRPIEQTINIGTKNIQKIIEQQAKVSEVRLFNINPPATGYYKVGAEVRSTFENEILNAISTNPLSNINKQTSELLQSGEIGVFKVPRPFGKEDIYVSLTKVKKVGTGQPEFTGIIFKRTKAGNLIKPRYLAGDNRFTTLFREAYPSELTSFNVPVQENIQPLNVYEAERLKPIKVLASKRGQYTIESKNVGETLIRRTSGESTVLKVGGQQSGTLSAEDVGQISKANRVVKFEEPIPIAKVKSIKFEVITPKKDILMETGIEGVNVKAGEFGITQTQEIGTIKNIKEPIEFDITRQISKGIKNVKEPKITIQKSVQKVEPFNIKEIIPKESAKPTYVGGEGGIDAKSLYEFNPDFSKVPTRQDLSNIDAEAFGGIISEPAKVPKIKPISELESKGAVRFPEFNINTREFENVRVPKTNLNTPSKESEILRGESANRLNAKELKALTGITSQSFNLGGGQQQPQLSSQIQKITTRQPQIPKDLLEIYPNMPNVNFEPPNINIRPTDIGLPFGGSGSQNAGNKEIKRLIRKRGRPPKPKYTASVGSAALEVKPFKVTKKQLDFLNEATYSGFEARPVLELSPDKEVKRNIKKINRVQF